MKDNNENKKIFADIFYALAEEFGGRISKRNLALKFAALKEYSMEQISGAAGWILYNRTINYPNVPTIKEFRTAIESPKISIDSQAEIQATKIFVLLKNNGANFDPDFKDKTTKRIMTKIWPWRSWAKNILEKELVWWKKDFVAIYKSLKEHDHAFQISPENKNKLIEILKIKNVTKKICR